MCSGITFFIRLKNTNNPKNELIRQNRLASTLIMLDPVNNKKKTKGDLLIYLDEN